MRFYAPLAKIDAAEHMVWGYASTEAEDDQGEIVTRDALAAALADYLKFANIREMHQLSAVGVAEEAAVDDRGLYIGARIVDPRAWDKVAAGVYKGYSIGGRVKSRDPADHHIITGLSLTEISLVDRPANPEAVFDCWKAEGGRHMADMAAAGHQPVQIWHCGVTAHRHLVKSEAARCLERRGEEVEGGVEKSDLAEPPATIIVGDAKAMVPDALRKSGGDTDRIGQIIGDLEWLCGFLHGLVGTDASDGGKGARGGDLAKALAGEIVPRLDALAKRVEDIAATPLPPQTVARSFAGISKREDGGGSGLGDDVVAALSRMSDEERTLTLIKAAHANPIRPAGIPRG